MGCGPCKRRPLTEQRQLLEPVEQLLQAGVVGAGLPRVGQGGADAGQQESALAGHGEAAAGPGEEPRFLGGHGHGHGHGGCVRVCVGGDGTHDTGPGGERPPRVRPVTSRNRRYRPRPQSECRKDGGVAEGDRSGGVAPARSVGGRAGGVTGGCCRGRVPRRRSEGSARGGRGCSEGRAPPAVVSGQDGGAEPAVVRASPQPAGVSCLSGPLGGTRAPRQGRGPPGCARRRRRRRC